MEVDKDSGLRTLIPDTTQQSQSAKKQKTSQEKEASWDWTQGTSQGRDQWQQWKKSDDTSTGSGGGSSSGGQAGPSK